MAPTPVAREKVFYSCRVPEPRSRGGVTAALIAGGPCSDLDGPGGRLVYVEWDPDGLACGVSMRDLKLEPAEDGHPFRPRPTSYLREALGPSQF